MRGSRSIVRFAAILLVFAANLHSSEPVSLCDVAADPAKYDRSVLEITAYVSHGFEDFTLFDPRCPDSDFRVWLEYGGKFSSGTIYCCGVTAERTRKEPLVVEGIPTTIADDAKLARFDRILQSEPQTGLHATLRGRFFAGQEQQWPSGKFWGGYGHMGMSSLFVIEQVLSLDERDRRDLDYSTFVAEQEGDCQPRAWHHPRRSEAIEAQRGADSGERAWAFTDSARVAKEALSAGATVKLVRRERARMTYEGTTGEPHRKYTITVSRPFWLAAIAKDPHNIAWVVLETARADCDASP